jgi:hypothetical protein
LNEWSQGDKELSLKDANDLRGFIADGVNAYIDWDQEFLKPVNVSDTYYRKWVFIAGSKGGEPKATENNSMVTVCREDEWGDPKKSPDLVLTLMAIIRFAENNKKWDYEDGVVDCARYANFMERASQQATEFCRRRYYRVEANNVDPLAQALLIGSRILQLDDPSRTGESEAVWAIFALPVENKTGVGNTTVFCPKWDELVRNCSEIRSQLRDGLLQQIGVRQGGGNLVHALDISQLLDAIKEVKKNWRVGSQPPPNAGLPDYERIRQHVASLNGRLEAATQDKLERILKWKAQVEKWLGPNFKKQQTVEILEKTLNSAWNLDTFEARDEIEIMRSKIRTFDECDVSSILLGLNQLNATNETGTVLASLARVDVGVIMKISDLMESYGAFLNRTTQRINRRLEASPEKGRLDKKIKEVNDQLESLEENIQSYNSGRSHQ